METGKYDREEKEGNDNSDEAAGKGSSISKDFTTNGSDVPCDALNGDCGLRGLEGLGGVPASGNPNI